MDGAVLLYAKDQVTDSIIYKYENSNFDVKATLQYGAIITIGYPFCYGNLDSVFWFKHQSIDTLYRTSDFKTVRPWYVFKKKDSFANYEHCVHRMVLDVSVYRPIINATLPVGNGVLYNISGGKEDSGMGFCRTNEKARTYSPIPFKNDVDGYLKSFDMKCVQAGTSFQKNGYLYLLVEAADFFEEGSKSPFPTLTEDSNPVVVKFKLKKE